MRQAIYVLVGVLAGFLLAGIDLRGCDGTRGPAGDAGCATYQGRRSRCTSWAPSSGPVYTFFWRAAASRTQ